VVSKPVLISLRLFFCREMATGCSQRLEIVVYRVVGRQGWILKEVIGDLCIEVVCTMRVIGFNS
jgi:hypothetical protein